MAEEIKLNNLEKFLELLARAAQYAKTGNPSLERILKLDDPSTSIYYKKYNQNSDEVWSDLKKGINALTKEVQEEENEKNEDLKVASKEITPESASKLDPRYVWEVKQASSTDSNKTDFNNLIKERANDRYETGEGQNKTVIPENMNDQVLTFLRKSAALSPKEAEELSKLYD